METLKSEEANPRKRLSSVLNEISQLFPENYFDHRKGFYQIQEVLDGIKESDSPEIIQSFSRMLILLKHKNIWERAMEENESLPFFLDLLYESMLLAKEDLSKYRKYYEIICGNRHSEYIWEWEKSSSANPGQLAGQIFEEKDNELDWKTFILKFESADLGYKRQKPDSLSDIVKNNMKILLEVSRNETVTEEKFRKFARSIIYNSAVKPNFFLWEKNI